MHIKRIDKKGFTLIELIITVAVLAVISIPLLQYFTESAKHNARAKNQQNAMVAAQNTLEELKAESVDITTPTALVATSGAISPAAISKGWSLQSIPDANGKYELSRSCTVNGFSYKVLASIKPVKAFINASSAAVSYYDMEVPKMDTSKDVIATERGVSLVNAQMQFYNWYSAYCDNHGLAKTITPAYFRDKLSKKVCIKLEKDSAKPTNVLTRVYYSYTFAGASYPNGISSSSVYEEDIVKKSIPAGKLEDIYIFYTPDTVTSKDSIKIKADTVGLTHLINNKQINLFIISQNTASSNELEVDADGTSDMYFDSIYSNIKATNTISGSMRTMFVKDASGEYQMIKKNSKNRVADIEVSVYKGDSMIAANLCTTVKGSIAQK